MHAPPRTTTAVGLPRFILSRRRFLTAATGLTAAALAAPTALAHSYAGVYVDSAATCPVPDSRMVHVVVRLKPSSWAGWPGTAFDLEGRRREYARSFAQAAQTVGIQLDQCHAPLEDDGAIAAFEQEIRTKPPHAVLVSLQHFDAWPWATLIASAGVPTVVFAPVGPGFGDCVRSVAPVYGMHVIALDDVASVEQAFRLVRAKRQIEATRILCVGRHRISEERMAGTGLTLRRIPRSRFRTICANAHARGGNLEDAVRGLLEHEGCQGLVFGQDGEVHTALSLCLARYAFGEEAELCVLRSQSDSLLRDRPLRAWEAGQPVTVAQFHGPHRLLAAQGTVIDRARPLHGVIRHSRADIRIDTAFDMSKTSECCPVAIRGSHLGGLKAFCRLYGIEFVDASEARA